MSDGGHRRGWPRSGTNRLGLRWPGPRWLGPAALVAAIGVATVTVPPMIAPTRTGLPPTPATVPAESSKPAATTPPCEERRPRCDACEGGHAVTVSIAAAPARCAAAGSPEQVLIDPAHPSCVVYARTLGSGWVLTGEGMRVLPDERVPGSSQRALRLEPRDSDPVVTFAATVPVAVTARTTLRIDVYGARSSGTSLRVSALSASGAPSGRAILLTAAPDRWTTFSVPLATVMPTRATDVRRLRVAVATDLMPHAGRFFLDDIRIVS